jgi:hypothetical protein
MKLDIILEEYSFDAVTSGAEKHFGCRLNYEKEISIFDQWRIGCKEKFIPQIWIYRIVKKDDRYFFGTVQHSSGA